MSCCRSSITDSTIDDLPKKDGVIDFRQNHGCCRDLYCLIAFCFAVVAMIVIFAVGFREGDPKKLYYPLNIDGYYCGMKSSVNGEEKDFTNFPYFLYLSLLNLSFGLCVDESPHLEKFCVYKNGTLYSNEKCRNDPNSYYYDYLNNWEIDILNLDIEELAKQVMISQLIVVNDSLELIRRCIPNLPQVLEKLHEFSKEYGAISNIYTTAVSDIKEAYPLFIISIGITLFVCFIIFCFLQLCAKCIVWVLLIAAIVVIFLVGGISLYYGIKYYHAALPADKTSSTIMIIFASGVLIAGILIFFIVFGLHSRISLATTIVEEAGRAIRNNCCLFFVPVVYALLFVVGVVLILITMVYYFSALEIDTTLGKHTIVFTKWTRGIVLLSVLIFFWWTFFVIGLNQFTIASVGATWYFSRTVNDLPLFPVARALKVLIFHHLGSVAVGSFFIALVATFRTILLYLSKKVKASKNETLSALLKVLQCCLGCLQKIIEFIASRAYIMMAINGKCFWYSAFDALKLMISNPIRTFFMTGISKFIIIMGEMMVVGLTMFIVFVILRPDSFVNGAESPFPVIYWWFVLFICLLIALFVVFIAFAIYEFLIDTLFMCFLEDEAMEEKYRDNYQTYATKALRDCMDVDDENAKYVEKELSSFKKREKLKKERNERLLRKERTVKVDASNDSSDNCISPVDQ